MIKAVLVINNQGKVRLSKFYIHFEEETQQQIEREVYAIVSRRAERSCNFVELGSSASNSAAAASWGADTKLIYRHYATLFFIFAVDSSESELGILDLIQAFVEALDKCFENVCELDIIFHMDKVESLFSPPFLRLSFLKKLLKNCVSLLNKGHTHKKKH